MINKNKNNEKKPLTIEVSDGPIEFLDIAVKSSLFEKNLAEQSSSSEDLEEVTKRSLFGPVTSKNYEIGEEMFHIIPAIFSDIQTARYYADEGQTFKFFTNEEDIRILKQFFGRSTYAIGVFSEILLNTKALNPENYEIEEVVSRENSFYSHVPFCNFRYSDEEIFNGSDPSKPFDVELTRRVYEWKTKNVFKDCEFVGLHFNFVLISGGTLLSRS